MSDFPQGFNQAEASYNRNYDPYAEICPVCSAEDSFNEDNFELHGELYTRIICTCCGYEVDND